MRRNAKPAAEFAGAAGIRHHVELGDAAGKFGFENLDRRDVQIAEVGRDRRGAVIAVAAAIGRAEDLVLQRRLARPAAILPGDQHGAARAAIGERALGTERRQRLEDHVDEL